jgi:hypothetical protein
MRALTADEPIRGHFAHSLLPMPQVDIAVTGYVTSRRKFPTARRLGFAVSSDVYGMELLRHFFIFGPARMEGLFRSALPPGGVVIRLEIIARHVGVLYKQIGIRYAPIPPATPMLVVARIVRCDFDPRGCNRFA